MVDFSPDAVCSEECVYLKCKVKCRTTSWHGLYFTFWCKDKYFRSKEVQLYGVKKIHCIGLWVIKYFLDGAQPVVEFSIIFCYFSPSLYFQ